VSVIATWSDSSGYAPFASEKNSVPRVAPRSGFPQEHPHGQFVRSLNSRDFDPAVILATHNSWMLKKNANNPTRAAPLPSFLRFGFVGKGRVCYPGVFHCFSS
jgi:hypothetical protein